LLLLLLELFLREKSLEIAIIETPTNNSTDNTKNKEIEEAGKRDTLFINYNNIEIKNLDLDN
jgi:hypothetical protein